MPAKALLAQFYLELFLRWALREGVAKYSRQRYTNGKSLLVSTFNTIFTCFSREKKLFRNCTDLC
jgi:hypothetical protein